MCEQTCPSCAGPEPMLQAGNLHWGQEKSVKFQPPVHILLVEIPEIYAMHACRWIGGWTGAFLINAMIAAYFLTFGVGFGIWAALKNLVDNINKVFCLCQLLSSEALHLPSAIPQYNESLEPAMPARLC